MKNTLSSAPDAPFIFSAIFFKSIPRIKFILLEWIFKISRRDCIKKKIIFRNICYVCRRCIFFPSTNISRGNMKTKMQTSSLGFGNSIFLSIRPGLSSAWSRMSIRFVAIKTYNCKFLFRISSKHCELISQMSQIEWIIFVHLLQIYIYCSAQHASFRIPFNTL